MFREEGVGNFISPTKGLSNARRRGRPKPRQKKGTFLQRLSFFVRNFKEGLSSRIQNGKLVMSTKYYL